ncbi:hypothetical protein Tco_1453345, partial [Tanacetum coccineum]
MFRPKRYESARIVPVRIPLVKVLSLRDDACTKAFSKGFPTMTILAPKVSPQGRFLYFRVLEGYQDLCCLLYVAQSQPSSSTILVPSTSLPPEQSLPPVPTPIPASTPTLIPKTDPEPMEHTVEEPSPAYQHFSPPQEHAQEQMSVDDLLQVVPQLMT